MKFLSILNVYVLLFVADPERVGIICLVDSLECYGGFWHSAQVHSWSTGPTGQHHHPHHSPLVHSNLVRLEIKGTPYIYFKLYGMILHKIIVWKCMLLPLGSSCRASC